VPPSKVPGQKVAPHAIVVRGCWGSRGQVQRLSWLVYTNHLPNEDPDVGPAPAILPPPGLPG
jgi:hypothetical protein